MEDDETDQGIREHLASEVHQFTSLVRARIAQALDREAAADDPRAGDQHVEAWEEIYGRVVIELRPGEDLGQRVGQLMHQKLNVAALVTANLAIEISNMTDLTAIEVLDRIEQRLAEGPGLGGEGET